MTITLNHCWPNWYSLAVMLFLRGYMDNPTAKLAPIPYSAHPPWIEDSATPNWLPWFCSDTSLFLLLRRPAYGYDWSGHMLFFMLQQLTSGRQSLYCRSGFHLPSPPPLPFVKVSQNTSPWIQGLPNEPAYSYSLRRTLGTAGGLSTRCSWIQSTYN